MEATCETNARYIVRRHRDRISSAERQIAMYEELLAVAKRHGGEYEVERLGRCLTEMVNELDDCIVRAMEAGLAPEDFE